MLVLGMSGGWNSHALRRLIAMAHARGLTSEDVVHVLSSMAGRAANPGLRKSAAQSAPREVPAPQPDPAERALRRTLALGCFGVALLVASATGIIWLARRTLDRPTPPDPAPTRIIDATPASKSTTSATPAPPSPAPRPSPEREANSELAGIAGLAREIRGATDDASIDAQAGLRRFVHAIDELARSWPRIPRDQLIAANDAVVEYLYRTSSDASVFSSAMETVAAPADVLRGTDPPAAATILPAIWSNGLLARLSRESDLPSAARERLRASPLFQSPTAPIDPTFDAGRLAAMGSLPARMIARSPADSTPSVAPLDAWRAWMLAVDGVGVDEPPGRARFILNAIESILVDAREPDRDRSVLAAVVELVSRLSWRADEGSRPVLVRWLSDRRISAADLRVVTGALASRTGAEGVDPTMVLSSGADQADREALRERFATVWGIAEAVSRDQTRRAWADAARDALQGAEAARSDEELMLALARLSAIHEAASWIYRGDSTEASRVLAVIPTSAPAPQPPPPDPSLSDGAWAERYFASRPATKERRDLLTQLLAPNVVLGPIDAEVIVGEWGTTASAEVRTLTTQIIRQCSGQESIANALLERLPRIPIAQSSQSILELVSARSLPSVRDPAWRPAARRALVERLLDLKGSLDGRAIIDRLSDSVARSYRGIAAPAPLTPDQRLASVQPTAAESAGLGVAQLRQQIDRMIPASPAPLTPTQIDRLRVSRMAQARGPIQQFAAQQASLAELLAYAAHTEQPARVAETRAAFDRMHAARRDAKHIFQQLTHTEAAIVRFWTIRLGEDAP